ncbi:RHS repeat-associated core domain-containing protein [Kribbella sp. NPDC051587]|uniref:RHS repeat-associated core domain-containing protein n=1 Tax=Kribbella sp. NPDC051587 TaxID=3364119 RepID=UPI0037B37685
MSRRSRWSSLRVTVGSLLAASLIVSGAHLHAQAAPKPDPRKSVWTPRADKPVPIKAITPVPRGADPDDQWTVTNSGPTAWPAPGRAEVQVPRPAAPPTDWKGLVTGGPAPDRAPVAKAGALPISLGPTAAANLAMARSASASASTRTTPAKVEVDLLGRRGDELRLRLRRSDGVSDNGQVSLRVDYSGFAGTFGGDWATRLRVVDPATGRAVATRNDGSGTLSADVPVSARAKEFTVAAAADGAAGAATSTPLNPAATWQAGGSSGDFTWNYPMQTPPGLGGPTPQVALSYSSGSVDGRTTTANSQSGWVGAGFDLAPGGSIERRYASCAAKSEQTGNNGTTPVGDLCWATDNATFSLAGAGGELIRDDSTQKWHPRSDDGVTVERLTGRANGDEGPETGDGARGEYWVLTDRSGTKFYFGLNNLAGSSTPTNSVWTVPVFGNHSSEPCHQTAFAASSCKQAYKWNLDYVVDTHGNTMRYFYDVETNNYGRAGSKTSVSTYTRAGNIRSIEYGQREGTGAGSDKPVAKVTFVTAPRCTKTSDCAASDYPDTPLDQECGSTTSCANLYPTFWTKKQLFSVTTEVDRGSSYAPVTRWTPRYGWLRPGDGRSPMLWLQGITQTGLVGGTKALPEITFDAVMKANRIVGPGDGLPSMEWPRIRTVTYGTGGKVTVSYLEPDCSLPGNVPAPDTNGKRCHPIKWTPENQAERQDWFGKYVVSEVTEADEVSGLTAATTAYTYPNPPAWRFDEEDGLVEVGEKTWSQWRGFDKVTATKGDASGPQTVTTSTYFRGMDGDKLAAGGTKSVQIKDSAGGSWPDSNALAGMLREQTTLSGTTVVTRSITDPWISQATATRVRSWGTAQAFQIQEQNVNEAQAVGAGWRKTSVHNEYSPTGQLVSSSDKGDEATTADDTCTTYTYFSNPDRGLVDLPAGKEVVDLTCDKAATKDDLISGEKEQLDAQTGDIVSVQRVSGFDSANAPIYQTVATTTYDEYGRPRLTKDAAAKETAITYTPAAGALTQTSTKQPTGLVTTSVVDPAWGEPLAVVDEGNRRTDTTRDPLGRVTATFLPGRDRKGTADARYEYTDSAGRPSISKLSVLQADNSISDTYQLLDGMGRVRQTQKPGANGIGWVLTDYVYDSRGLLTQENGPYYAESRPSNGLVAAPQRLADVPAQKVTQYDDQGLPSTERFFVEGALKWTTTHSTSTGIETIDPPAGEQATTRLTDAQGRLTELRQYRGDAPTGSYDATKYTYWPAGQLATVTDAAGNKWRYDYDLRGRKIQDTEPDRGITKYTWDDRDRMTSTTDSRGVKLSYSYDDNGRRTGEYLGETTDGKLLADWKYDTLKPGSLTSSTRYADGKAYTLRMSGYDERGRPTGSVLDVPSLDGKPARTLTSATTFTADGQPDTVTMPGVGGLPEETLKTTYTAQSQPATLSGADDYVIDSKYTAYGELSELSLTQGSNWLQQQFSYEKGTHRLARSGVITPNELVQNLDYGYDSAGNITKITDTTGPSEGSATDTQCFNYDQARQLTQAWTPGNGDCTAAPSTAALGGPAPYWHSWTIDAIGNRKTETRRSTAGTTTSTYTYSTTKPHAAEQVAVKGPGVDRTDSYSYNAAGQQSAAPGQTLTWDSEGHVGSVTAGGRTTSFIYDADGNRLLRKDQTGTTLYFGQTELLLKADGTETGTRYYEFAGQAIAVRTGAKLTWVTTDHHGTIDLSIDPATLVVQRRRTTPYGELRGAAPASWPGEHGFVGGTEDATGLVHLGAREYNPVLGKFISVDPVVDPNDPQQLNAYSYANNSPVTFSDSDGNRFVLDTVTQLKIQIRAVTKRVVEYKREVIKLTARTVNAGRMAQMAMALGKFALAAALMRGMVTYQVKIKRIVRYVTTLVREVVRITKTVRRFDPTGGIEDTVKELARAANDVWKAAAAVKDGAGVPPRPDLNKILGKWFQGAAAKFYDFTWNDFMHWEADGPQDMADDRIGFFGGAGGVVGTLAGGGSPISAVTGGVYGMMLPGAWNDVHDKNGQAHWSRVVPWLLPTAGPMFVGRQIGKGLVNSFQQVMPWLTNPRALAAQIPRK